MSDPKESKGKVLIVEDESAQIVLLSIFLQRAGFESVEVNSREEVDKALENLDGVVAAIVDGSLSDETKQTTRDGEEVTKLIKAENPAIIVVGHSGSGIIEDANKNYQKPSHPKEIITYLESQLLLSNSAAD